MASRKLKWAGYVTRMKNKEIHSQFCGNLFENIHLYDRGADVRTFLGWFSKG
jgi:hypothetical protein